jgi:hypothetical protein
MRPGCRFIIANGLNRIVENACDYISGNVKLSPKYSIRDKLGGQSLFIFKVSIHLGISFVLTPLEQLASLSGGHAIPLGRYSTI